MPYTPRDVWCPNMEACQTCLLRSRCGKTLQDCMSKTLRCKNAYAACMPTCFFVFATPENRTLDRSLFEPSNSTVKYQTADGRQKFHGSRHLKATQVYPPRFGRRVACPLYHTF